MSVDEIDLREFIAVANTPNPKRRPSRNGYGKKNKDKRKSKFERGEFITWDGEGMDINGRHEYVLLMGADRSKVVASVENSKGLDTHTIFQTLLNVASKYPHAYHVIYGGSYDYNMWLTSLPTIKLYELNVFGKCTYYSDHDDYYIAWRPRKYFYVKSLNTGQSVRVYDVIGFFQSSFVNSLQTWLGVTDETINAGKLARGSFTLDDLPMVSSYCAQELKLFQLLMRELHYALMSAGIPITSWHGAGAIASTLLQQHAAKLYIGPPVMQIGEYKYYYATRECYFGGRFELIKPGYHRGPIYVYDINSAYPAALSMLPSYNGLRETYSKSSLEFINDNSLYYIRFSGKDGQPFYPLAYRDNTYSVCYPKDVERWVYGCELKCIMDYQLGDIEILKSLEPIGIDDRPWAWVADLYSLRRELKTNGDSAERAIKLGINSLYGKLAQRVGGRINSDGTLKLPTYHNLYLAGLITARTRSKLFHAMMLHPSDVIACETDSVITTHKLDTLPISDKLGEWSYKHYEWINYIQSGIYFYSENGKEVQAKYRGLDKGTLSHNKLRRAQEHMRPYVTAKHTRFITLGQAMMLGNLDEWRQWRTKDIKISLTGGDTKRRYLRDGSTVPVDVETPLSVPHEIPWVDDEQQGRYRVFIRDIISGTDLVDGVE